MDFAINSTFNEEKKYWDIELQGEVDIYNSKSFQTSLCGLIEENPSDLHISCQKLEYIDSTGLGALVSVLKKVKQYQGDIYLSQLKSNVAKVFKITDLNKVFIIEGDINE